MQMLEPLAFFLSAALYARLKTNTARWKVRRNSWEFANYERIIENCCLRSCWKIDGSCCCCCCCCCIAGQPMITAFNWIYKNLFAYWSSTSKWQAGGTAMSEEWLWNKNCWILKCVDCELQIVGRHCWGCDRRDGRRWEFFWRVRLTSWELWALRCYRVLGAVEPLKWGIGNWTGCLRERLEILESKWIL